MFPKMGQVEVFEHVADTDDGKIGEEDQKCHAAIIPAFRTTVKEETARTGLHLISLEKFSTSFGLQEEP
ncbi:MAG: hypothetical protein H6Q98_654 [Nitrospirae bacterium]|nr:hypothetical protein [Nitrospirota bacterium]